jgi:hypothetical protein
MDYRGLVDHVTKVHGGYFGHGQDCPHDGGRRAAPARSHEVDHIYGVKTRTVAPLGVHICDPQADNWSLSGRAASVQAFSCGGKSGREEKE